MATFDTKGFDELIKQFGLEEERVKRQAPKAVMAAGKVVFDETQRTAPRQEGGGELAASIRLEGPFHNLLNGYYCDVYPDGTRKSGERNATVGFVLEYGRSDMEPRPWMRTALERVQDEAQNAMADILTEEIT